jgi:hypothetical protein
MRFSALLLLIGLSFSSFTPVNAAGLVLSERDCMDILERWAADPTSVPQHLVDECKNMMGAGTASAADSPVPDISPAAGQAAADPCSGPEAADSVLCWGPWRSLAPAAGGLPPVALSDVDEFDPRPELASDLGGSLTPVNDPGPNPNDPVDPVDPVDPSDPTIPNPTKIEAPLGECSPGAACGFATLAPGLITQPEDASEIEVVRFELAPDGSGFAVDPGGSSQTGTVISVDNLESPDIPGPPSRFEGTNGDDLESKLVTNVERDDEGNIKLATGNWRHGDLIRGKDSDTRSGVFVWGVASTQTTLDSLNNGGAGVSLGFSGVMLRDPDTSANMTINFGAQPNWTGNWSNSVENFQFDAGGKVGGVNLVSDPSQFSANVQGSDSFVQGVILGERGDLSVGHAINVNLNSGESIKDVGLLRQR